MTRNEIREVLMQMMYEMDAAKTLDLETARKLAGEKLPEKNLKRSLQILSGIIEHLDEIDGSINAHSRSWKTSRMPKVDLAIMRLALGEVRYGDDVPEAVAEIPAGACAETAEAPQDGCATAAAEALPDGEDSVEQKLFDDEPVTRHRVDKRVILSLYGDVPAASPYPASASYRKHEEAAGLPTVSEPEGISSHTAVPDGGTSKKVLGEVLAGSGATAMNEVLGKQTLHADVASKIQQGIRGELRQHIGVNDRFMLIRNLFGGDAAAYSATIERPNSKCTSRSPMRRWLWTIENNEAKLGIGSFSGTS